MDDRLRRFEYFTRWLGALVAFVACAVLIGVSLHGQAERAKLLGKQEVIVKIDPALIRYRMVKTISVPLKEARGIAVGPDGSLYVAGEAIYRYMQGKPQRLTLQPISATCLTVGDDGTLLLGETDHVTIVQQDGSLRKWPTPGRNAYITSLAVAGNDVWVADAGRRVVYHYNRQGALLGKIGEKHLVAPSPHLDVAAGTDGLLWVANPGKHCLEAYRNGKMISSWGKVGMDVVGFSGCCNPADFAMLPDGRFVTADKGTGLVRVFRRNGSLDAVVAEFPPGSEALDVAVDRQGKVSVLDREHGVVKVFERMKNEK